tara:strand:+ start:210 stop:749 length:540 start_codon:yes stop_codon:yes gene_type:complete
MVDKRDKQIQDLVNMNLQLMERIRFLEARVLELEKELAKYRTPKNSNNSSIPPSKDENRPKKTQRLRENSGKKPGGQPGHEGHTLEMSSVPDAITDHIPGFCSCCGYDLSSITAELSSKRQVIDLPVISPVCTEHKNYFEHTFPVPFPVCYISAAYYLFFQFKCVPIQLIPFLFFLEGR